MVSPTTTCLHPDKTGCTVREVLKKFRSLNCLVHDLASFPVNVMHLEYLLGDVDTYGHTVLFIAILYCSSWILQLPGNACIFHQGTSMPLAREDPPSFFAHSVTGVGRVHFILPVRMSFPASQDAEPPAARVQPTSPSRSHTTRVGVARLSV
ncbi:MAG: hypothetical protein E5299_01822 [Burkholderia gladioli]|nr:MAG: hypothetical protein E5299_01822 [Burkholderia gladioli]